MHILIMKLPNSAKLHTVIAFRLTLTTGFNIVHDDLLEKNENVHEKNYFEVLKFVNAL